MEVRIGEISIPDAEVERFIDLQSGLALSIIEVSYEGKPFEELVKAMREHKLLPLECEIIKTRVFVIGIRRGMRLSVCILQESEANVSCGYKLIHTNVGNEKAIILPEDTNIDIKKIQRVREIPFIRLILRKDIQKDLFKTITSL